MSLVGAAAITGIGGILGGAATGQANAKEASKNRDWQERMSNTSHQRQVADMKAAGLNPIMSGMGGSGASTGSGAQASMPDMSGIGSQAMSGAATAQQIKQNRASTDIQESNAKQAALDLKLREAEQLAMSQSPLMFEGHMNKKYGGLTGWQNQVGSALTWGSKAIANKYQQIAKMLEPGEDFDINNPVHRMYLGLGPKSKDVTVTAKKKRKRRRRM